MARTPYAKPRLQSHCGSQSARADSEDSNHPSDDERERLEEVFEQRTLRAKRASIETHREEEMVDEEGFSAMETSAAMAASTAAPPSAAERAGKLGDDVLALLGDLMRSDQVDNSEVLNRLHNVGTSLFRVKRALETSDHQTTAREWCVACCCVWCVSFSI